MILVETAADVEKIVVDNPNKVAYLTQTTLSVDDANIVIAALRKKFPNIANPPKDDICYATQNRQEAVRDLAAQADLVLVLGSQNSSNSRRLAEIANGLGIPSHLIDGVAEIQNEWFRDAETVLITAGASAPEQVVQECIEYLEANFGATIRERVPFGNESCSIFRSPGRSGSCCPRRPSRPTTHRSRKRWKRSSLSMRPPAGLE